MANHASLQVNEVSVEWDEISTRKAKLCSGCRVMTQGRMKSVQNGVKASVPMCVKCFPASMAKLAFKPVGEVTGLIRRTFGGRG